jgi:hypothetical protein
MCLYVFVPFNFHGMETCHLFKETTINVACANISSNVCCGKIKYIKNIFLFFKIYL